MALADAVTGVAGGNNLLLFVVLIALFVVAYKVLQAVINTALVAVLSGVFVVALDMVGIGPPATVQTVLLFAVLGTGSFILYSTLATTWTVARELSSLLGSAAALVTDPLRDWLAAARERARREDGAKEKEIVLDEIRDEE